MNMNSFCDADNLATWLFDWALGCLLLGFVTVIFMNAISTHKEIKNRQANNELYKKKTLEIFDEIQNAQKDARLQLEAAQTSHDKAKALYAYEQVEKCLSMFDYKPANSKGQ